jgi:hypothetical protein
MALPQQAREVPYGIGDWDFHTLGNHRARVFVNEAADAVYVHLPWRRHDRAPEEKAILVFDAASGEAITNVVVLSVNQEYADLVFQPHTVPGEYYLYYLAHTSRLENGWEYIVDYVPPSDTAEAAWLARHGLNCAGARDIVQRLPRAEVLAFEARNARHAFYPMEVCATRDEVLAFRAQHAGAPYLTFPEDRGHPIRLFDALPLCWVQRGPSMTFQGEACRGEYYVFQIGVYAQDAAVEHLRVSFSDLRAADGAQVIPADQCTCFNTEGIDWTGQHFSKDVTVEAGRVGACWLGLQVPREAQPGTYTGEVTLTPAHAAPTTVQVVLQVTDTVLDDAGDGELWRLSRLRWLNSTIGLDDEVVAPYTPVEVDGDTLHILNRTVTLNAQGLPESITSHGREVLAHPVRLCVETENGVLSWQGGGISITRQAPALVAWEAIAENAQATLACHAELESDGYLIYSLTLTPKQRLDVRDIRLEIPLVRRVAKYMVGMGKRGGYRMEDWQWTWNAKHTNNQLWLGDVDAGLYCKLKDVVDRWELYTFEPHGVPPSWYNAGRGGSLISEVSDDTVLASMYSGARVLEAGEPIVFRFSLIITPMRPISPEHWQYRYDQTMHGRKFDDVDLVSLLDEYAARGAKIVNVHEGCPANPYINYPFVTADIERELAEAAHARGMKLKLYYTVRELSSYVAELWPLRSLGYEIFTDGDGGGHSWLCEHLIDHYSKKWHAQLRGGETDPAIGTTGLSRWHNYYLQGLAWLIAQVGIDGIYLDGIGYDRQIMKRVRKVLDRAKPGSLIDFHAGNGFDAEDMRASSTSLFLEHLPYVDSIWWGEYYEYENESPDYWLVELSGIPFGVPGEMLEHHKTNLWRGMLYGMAARYHEGDTNPVPLWQLWDAFGIAEARMEGYWSPTCPVRTDRDGVLVTAYCTPGAVLLAIAGWTMEKASFRLLIDWQAIGIDPARAVLRAPDIGELQAAGSFAVNEDIPIEPKKGWILILSEA